MAGETVTVTTHDGDAMPAYVARPAPADANGAGVLVIHEILGLDDNAREKADRFAAEGYTALAPDLYAAGGRFCVMRASMMGGAGSGVYRYLEDARSHLAGLGGVDDARIGVAGFCMGGRFAVMLAGHNDGVKVAAPYYGSVPWFAKQRVGETCPVFGRWGGRDWMFRWSGKRLERLLDGRPDADVDVLPGLGHGYMNPGAGEDAFPYHLPPLFLRYDEEHAQESWGKMIEFFDRYLT